MWSAAKLKEVFKIIYIRVAKLRIIKKFKNKKTSFYTTVLMARLVIYRVLMLSIYYNYFKFFPYSTIENVDSVHKSIAYVYFF